MDTLYQFEWHQVIKGSIGIVVQHDMLIDIIYKGISKNRMPFTEKDTLTYHFSLYNILKKS